MGMIPAYLIGDRSGCRRFRPHRVTSFRWLGVAAACVAVACVALPARAQAQADQSIGGQRLKLLQPLDGATVRETVPIRMSRSVLPSGGYAAVIVDGTFRTAQVVPSKGELLYDWDTKEPFTTPDNPDQPQYTQDGPHDVQVQIYDHDGTLVGVAESHVKVANIINSMPDGVHLVYHWTLDEVLHYKYHSTLQQDDSVNGNGKQDIQDSDIKFDRSVEDVTGGEYLLRDLVRPNGFLISRTSPVLIQTAFTLKSRYRTVNRFGEVLVNNVPFSPGDHFGFPIPQFPDRRVNVGDSWESHMEVALGWNAEHPTTIAGTAKLDDFEWQDGYPTAKITETYDGPATFRLNGQATAPAAGDTTGQNTLEPVDASDVQITRTIWFAYNSGRLVKMETSMTVTADMSAEQVSALGIAGGNGAMSNPFPGMGRNERGYGGMPAGGPGGMPPGMMYGAPAGMPPPGYNPYAGGGPPGAMRFGPPGMGFRPPYMGGQQNPTVNQPKTPNKFVTSDVTTLIG